MCTIFTDSLYAFPVSNDTNELIPDREFFKTKIGKKEQYKEKEELIITSSKTKTKKRNDNKP
jgi:hypothetical protein